MDIDILIKEENLKIVLLFMIAVILVLLVFTPILFVKYTRLNKRYTKFMSGIYKGRDLGKIIETVTEQIRFQENKAVDIGKRIAAIENNMDFVIQKAGMVRYSAFQNKGGDQSFSVAMLDNKNNGYIITSIYNDGISSVYGKEIKEGKALHRLSEEEIKALEKAVESSETYMIKL